MTRTATQRTSFRRRLTWSFVVVAALSSGILALTSFLLVKRDREASFLERSLDKARLAASLSEARLTTASSDDDIEDLIAILNRRTGMDAVVTADGRTFASRPELQEPTLATSLDDAPDDDGLQYVEVDVDDVPFLVVHPTDPVDPQLYFLFSEQNLITQMSRLGGLLWRAWLGVAIVAALVGNLVARTALRPIARASTAATALAEGMLDTRLPIDRTDEFGAWAASFNEMAAALQQKVGELEAAAERERRFTSDVAHELRTPLSALVTSAQLLSAEKDDMGPQAAWAAERLTAEVRRLRRLVEELLEISRLDAGREAIRFATVDLRDLVGRLLVHHGWSERVHADLEPIEITTDPRRLDRVLSNLISNAFEHGKDPVTISGALSDSTVILRVRDHGPGLPSDAAEEVFDRFYKGDAARRGGSGLGLAIARENARLLGGDITFESTSDGTTFVAHIPVVPIESPTVDARVTS